MIQTHDLLFSYPAFTLCVKVFSVCKGESLAIVGPSGSGKTTLLSLLAGIEVPSAGSITIDGNKISALNEPARRAFRLAHIGQVFQRVELLEYLTIEENIVLPLRLANAPLNFERARALLKRVGLEEKAKRLPKTLSQGERQRAGICRALIAKPKVVLADEPTSSLDAATGAHVLDLFFDMVKEEQATLVCLTHDASILPRFGHVISMDELKGSSK